MDITLKNDEIVQAVTDYVANQGISLMNKNISVSFIAGRGSNGNSAIVEINPKKKNASSNKPTPRTKNKTTIGDLTSTHDDAVTAAKEAAKTTETSTEDVSTQENTKDTPAPSNDTNKDVFATTPNEDTNTSAIFGN